MSGQLPPKKKPRIRRGEKDDEIIVSVPNADGTVEDRVLKKGEKTVVHIDAPEDTRPDNPDVSEGDTDYMALAEELLKPVEVTSSIQVFDGKGDMTVDEFGYSSAGEIQSLIHYIESNGLQDVRPWALVYTLYRCLRDYAEAHP